MKEIEIRLYDVYTTSVSSRSSITTLLKKYYSESNLLISIDFANVHFVSRSAAQQLILERKALEPRNICFRYINIEFHINTILELAEHKLTRKQLDVKSVVFNNNKEFNEFILNFD
jgi:hypothetical protein